MNRKLCDIMTEEIRRSYLITDEERERLFNWGDDIFGAGSLDMSWRGKDVHFFLDVDGQVVSHASILKHEVSVGGRPVLVAGVGAVVTRPEAQGKGCARRLMQSAAEFFEREWQVEAGLLFCFERMVAYYESLGWQLVEAPVVVEQPSGNVNSPLPVMVLPCRGGAWSAGEVELRSRPW